MSSALKALAGSLIALGVACSSSRMSQVQDGSVNATDGRDGAPEDGAQQSCASDATRCAAAGPDGGPPEACTATTCESGGFECGTHPNGCGGKLSCGECQQGYECVRDTLCAPTCTVAEPTVLQGDLQIGPLDVEEGLEKLRGVREVTGTLTLRGNLLATLEDAACLETIGGNLDIQAPGLTTLSGFERLQSIGGDLSLSQMRSLRNPLRLDGVSSIGGGVWINDTSALTTLEGSPKVSELQFLVVQAVPSLATLRGLEELRRVEGTLWIWGASSLRDLRGLESLKRAGGIEIRQDLDALESVAGLASLTQVDGTLKIANTKKLASLSGLDRLENVGDWLQIYRHETLSDLALPSLESVGLLAVEHNPGVTRCEAERLAEQVDAVCSAAFQYTVCMDTCRCSGNANDAPCSEGD